MHIHWLVEIFIHFVVFWLILGSFMSAIAEAVDMDTNGSYGNDARPVIMTLLTVASVLITFECMWWGRWT